MDYFGTPQKSRLHRCKLWVLRPFNSYSWWGPWAEMDGQILLTFDRVRRIANMMWDFTFRYLLWNIPNNWGLTATVICKPFSDFLVAFKVWLASGWEHLFQQIWYVPWKRRRVCGQPRWQHWWNFVPKLHLELIWSDVWCWNWPPACRIFWCISSFFFSWKFSRFLLCVFGICEIFFASVLFLCWLPKVRLPASCESACCFTSKTAKQKSINSLPASISYLHSSCWSSRVQKDDTLLMSHLISTIFAMLFLRTVN